MCPNTSSDPGPISGRSDDPPDVSTVEQVAPADVFLSADRLDQLLADLRQAWSRGERVAARSYLARFPALAADPRAAAELLYQEFLLAQKAGGRPPFDDYLREYPQYAAELRALREADLLLGAAPPTAEPGDGLRRIGAYEIIDEVARGGMGVVYKAWHPQLKRRAAVKMIRAADYAGPEDLARFRGEAEMVARLRHPNIVQIYEIGEQEGQPYLCLEFIEGGSLAQNLAGEPQLAGEAAGLVKTLAEAVHHAHSNGVVHRDLKPANVLLRNEEPAGDFSPPAAGPPRPRNPLSACTPKVTDFGLAKRHDVKAGLTVTGAVLGSPPYMAPEQALGKPDVHWPLVDVYALGATLYEVLAGRPPFQGATTRDTLEQVVADEPVPPRRLQPKVPRDLETVCLKCLEKDPRKRYANAQELADDLGRFLDGRPIRARRVGPLGRAWRWCVRNPSRAGLAAVVLAVVLLAGGGWLWAQQSRAGRVRETARVANEAMGQAVQLREQAQAAPPVDLARWEAAGAAARRAQAAVEMGESDEETRLRVRHLVEELDQQVNTAREAATMEKRLAGIRTNAELKNSRLDWDRKARAYAGVFQDYLGTDVEALP